MKKKGFTLIELIATIAILAILAVIAVPRVISYVEKSKVITVKAEAKVIYNAAEAAYNNGLLVPTKYNIYPPAGFDYNKDTPLFKDMALFNYSNSKDKKGVIKVLEENNLLTSKEKDITSLVGKAATIEWLERIINSSSNNIKLDKKGNFDGFK
ncbi:type IV pilin protein [Clostridium sardiniense]|uniref:type IV pilin protein n=1 Tax=Clostridium sardiniense TaxID=29369 RepID=UPI001FAF98D0|nr:prepilin-type N-terminal cleavage/methylation domain-containing protein [Clostridium sardiniense]MBM7834442.1 type IV pilus assembly protein PilA [Clostridium sardiniense]